MICPLPTLPGGTAPTLSTALKTGFLGVPANWCLRSPIRNSKLPEHLPESFPGQLPEQLPGYLPACQIQGSNKYYFGAQIPLLISPRVISIWHGGRLGRRPLHIYIYIYIYISNGLRPNPPPCQIDTTPGLISKGIWAPK